MRLSFYLNNMGDLTSYPFYASVWGTFSDVLMLPITLITIFLLYVTFKSQEKQIADAKKDNELNRTTDLVYRQLEITRKVLTENYTDLINDICRLTKDDPSIFINEYSNERKKYNSLLSFLNNEVKIYKTLIYKRAFNLFDINFLRFVIVNNIGDGIFNAISVIKTIEGKFNSEEPVVSDTYIFTISLESFREIITKEGINEKFDISEGITNGFH